MQVDALTQAMRDRLGTNCVQTYYHSTVAPAFLESLHRYIRAAPTRARRPKKRRAHNVLHMRWQLFERRGSYASHVAQAWMLWQIIYRGAIVLSCGGPMAVMRDCSCVLPWGQMW